MECSTPVRRPGVVIIKTLAFLVLNSRPSDARYIQTPIRLPMRTNLRLKVVTGLLQCRNQPHHVVHIALALRSCTPFGEVDFVARGWYSSATVWRWATNCLPVDIRVIS